MIVLIFEQENVIFEILDVLYFDLASSKHYNYGRNFDALSFRYEADTVVETEKTQFEFNDNTIAYFPSNVKRKTQYVVLLYMILCHILFLAACRL